MSLRRQFVPLLLIALCILCNVTIAFGQTEAASLSGLITDLQGRPVTGVDVEITNQDTNISVHRTTNDTGLYVAVGLRPGRYRVSIAKEGFKKIDLTDLVLNVQDVLSRNFQLQLGPVSTSITVVADEIKINTTDATVSTVVDRNFAENLPMNGRSFQTLIQLTPGVVVTASTFSDSGQFSVNGQRPSSNYWSVDGVSANLGTSAGFQGNWVGGSLGSFSALGGTNSLVSVDALQEFRVQTSTYAPEYGRTPGGQISIVTRSGTNQFHGTAFDYLRNDLFDANDWFANSAGLPKPEERQNDFGGTFNGPLLRDRTFFFFSYEGLRLRLPEVALTDVPSVAARQNALPALQPFLNAFPIPNGPSSGVDQAQYNVTFSNRATLNAYSIRLDQKLGDKLTLFGRYNYSPSEVVQRGAGGNSVNTVSPIRIKTQTLTFGASWLMSPAATNDLRVNYSKTDASTNFFVDGFGGAVPPGSLGLPTPYTADNARLFFDIFPLANGAFLVGQNAANRQQQVNVVDSISIQKSSHSLKFGVDFRRLSPRQIPFLYGQSVFFDDVPSAETGNLSFSVVQSATNTTLLLRNLGIFAQDTWRVVPRLTVTYGLRWDVDFAPSALNGPNIPGVTGFNVNDLSHIGLAPIGTQPFRTQFGNFAPRIGLAYQIWQSQNWGTVVRGGFGVFYDLATQQLGNLIGQSAYPFAAEAFNFGGTFPLDPTTAASPPITVPGSGSGTVIGFDPDLRLPYTLQWNAALEQGLGRLQSLSVSYVGAVGRRLIQSTEVFSPNPNFGAAVLVSNTASSDYNALQVQFRRQLSNHLQALASYSWAHSIDDASEGSVGNSANLIVPGLDPKVNRGASDFDVRHAFSAAITYEAPFPKTNSFGRAVLGNWSLETVFQARSATPVDVFFANLFQISGGLAQVRPDLISGYPLYLFGSQYPGGKAFNNTPGLVAAGCPDGSASVGPFCSPPTDASGNPLRQGSLGRNTLRGFGAVQWDVGVHRDFPIYESLKLQFRAEIFNILNHPNFGPPQPAIDRAKFGQAIQMLGQSLNGGASGSNLGGGAFNPLYQIGGARSMQFALKLMF